MGRKKHSAKMHHMGSVWAKHAPHKHRQEGDRIFWRLGEQKRRRRQERLTCATVAELFRLR